MPAASVRVAAPAKLNLYLHVVGRREDGYHLLDSLVAFADIHDTVIAEPAGGLTLRVRGPAAAGLSGVEDNLVLRAARALASRAGVEGAAALTLIKRLPVASGIGGGSADAAATLLALERLWQVSLPPTEMAGLCLELGADVPVCHFGRAAHLGGVGERISAAPSLPEVPLVLVNPGVALSTPAVFSARAGPFSKAEPLASQAEDLETLVAALADRRNDLATAACELAPAIPECLRELHGTEGCRLSRMSGSGATCFGLFANHESATTAAATIAGRHPDWWVRAGRLISDTAVLSADGEAV